MSGFFFTTFWLFYQAFSLFRSLKKNFSIWYFNLGILFIAGGALLDAAITILYSPDFSEEANPIILTLLSLDLPIAIIYAFCLLYQIGMIGFTIFLWGIFLKNYSNIVKTIPYKSLFTTFKWLLGCGEMSLKDFLMNRKFNLYFFMLFCSLAIVLSHLNRWYFAMEWLKIVPRSNTMAISITLIVLFSSVLLIHLDVKLKNPLKTEAG